MFPRSVHELGKKIEVKLSVRVLHGRCVARAHKRPVAVGATDGVPLFQLVGWQALVQTCEDGLVADSGFGTTFQVRIRIF